VFPAILTEAQQTALELLSRLGEARTFYLAGGTALALHLGHRRSRDFDFFRAKEFMPQDLLSSLREAGPVRVLQEAAGTLTVVLREVPTSFFRYDYPLLRPTHESPWGMNLADPEDIAATKLAALAGRGSRKDFVDLYVYTRKIAPLEQTYKMAANPQLMAGFPSRPDAVGPAHRDGASFGRTTPAAPCSGSEPANRYHLAPPANSVATRTPGEGLQ
jgi:hypothetical protein